MGLFNKKKKKTHYDKGLMLCAMIFADINPDFAAEYERDPQNVSHRIVHTDAIDLFKRYFAAQLQPPVKWTYNIMVFVRTEMSREERALCQFWSDQTGEIIDPGIYRDTCASMRTYWKDCLTTEAFPDCDRSKLEDGFENIRFDFIPDKGIVLACTIIDDIIPLPE